VSIGDVNSNARGSGARYNDGKPKLEYVPARVLERFYAWKFEGWQHFMSDDVCRERCAALNALTGLARFEEGDVEGLYDALDALGQQGLEQACAQFHFGAQKYAAWNWAKGMVWSVPGACIKRHALAIFHGESIDRESLVPHLGAIACNLVMLLHFVDHYPEGDDRPPAACFGGGEAGPDAELERAFQDAEIARAMKDLLTKGVAVMRVDPAALYKPAENAATEFEHIYATGWSQEGKM